jgi:XTP/dITP diphosphohydrolase
MMNKKNKRKLLISTHNKAKFNQIKQLLGDIPFDPVSLDDVDIAFDVEETGKTYEENARLKAVTYAKISGLFSLADDSGLEIDALDGEPGIYSGRYAGLGKTDEQKIEFLLDKIKSVPEGKRQATFKCCMALAWPDGKSKVYHGQTTGTIALKPRGKPVVGFPYYRIYIPDGFNKTIAELHQEGIEYQSHRKRVLKDLIPDLIKAA